jgi:small subunit ribosomal protein S17
MAETNDNDQTTPAESSAPPAAGDDTPTEAVAEASPEEPVVDPGAEGDTAVEEEAAAEPVAEAPADEPAAEAAVEEEPVAEEAAAETPAAEAEAAAEGGQIPAQQESSGEPKRKKKRLPRSQRPQRSKPRREKPAERRPIVRLEKPEHERGRRQERQGTVVSDAMDKTIVVKVDTVKAHPRYKKVVRRSTKFHAHDEQNQAKAGDVVRIIETRPLSKTKRWRLAEIIEVAK